MGISLNKLQQKKLQMGLGKLANAGINVERWLAMCNADAAAMHHLVAAWPVHLPSFVYDAKTVCSVLGLPNNCTQEAPKASDGEVVIWYGGWTLRELMTTGKIVNQLSEDMAIWNAPIGYYHTRIPIPNSNRMRYDEQIIFLRRFHAALEELPMFIGATVLAVHLHITSTNLLKEELCRCAEVLSNGRHVTLDCRGSRVHVNCLWDDQSNENIFLGATRKANTLAS